MQTIDITPTWAQIMPILIMAIECGTDKGKREAKENLMEIARTLDNLNQQQQKD